jgi:uncharacterized tellurite resistance protein B-like protein
MLKQLIDQISDAISTPAESVDAEAQREAAIRSATAVLMIDVARADYVFDDTEFESVLRLIQSHFDLSGEDAAALVNMADERAERLTSLHEFTQLLHNNLDEREKARIVGLLWRIAYADGRLDKYEDALVLKISDLLHVSRGKVMQLKHEAETRPASL